MSLRPNFVLPLSIERLSRRNLEFGEDRSLNVNSIVALPRQFACAGGFFATIR
jgi:hypothetical protein